MDFGANVRKLALGALAISLLYQLAGFGTMHFVVPKPANWGN